MCTGGGREGGSRVRNVCASQDVPRLHSATCISRTYTCIHTECVAGRRAPPTQHSLGRLLRNQPLQRIRHATLFDSGLIRSSRRHPGDARRGGGSGKEEKEQEIHARARARGVKPLGTLSWRRRRNHLDRLRPSSLNVASCRARTYTHSRGECTRCTLLPCAASTPPPTYPPPSRRICSFGSVPRIGLSRVLPENFT